MKPKILHIQFIHLIAAIVLTAFSHLFCWDGFDGAYNERWAFGMQRIVFCTRRNAGNPEIYTINTDGSGLTRLTYYSYNVDPTWSPDGYHIAFISARDGNDEIYTMNIDGTEQTRLTVNTASDYRPSWSPDGSRVVFRSDRDGNNEIYTMNTDGTGQTRLTNNTAEDMDPAFSPDGSRIAFKSDRDGDAEIWIMNADGSNPVQLTFTTGIINEDPSWSPDGTRIVFARSNDICVMNTDGTGTPVNLTNNAAIDRQPSWSPDGNRIVFYSTRDGGDMEIYIMDSDGSNLTRLTDSSGWIIIPAGRRFEERMVPGIIILPDKNKMMQPLTCMQFRAICK